MAVSIRLGTGNPNAGAWQLQPPELEDASSLHGHYDREIEVLEALRKIEERLAEIAELATIADRLSQSVSPTN